MNKPVDNILLRKFAQLTWVDPKQVLINLRYVESILPTDLDEKTRRLRTNKLKIWRESRDAVLFAYGVSQTTLGTNVLVSNAEDSDYDFIMKWIKNDAEYFCPVQLKELPPTELNPSIAIEHIIEKLEKYSGEENLVVVVKINRAIKGFKLEPLSLGKKPDIRELWYFGCKTPDQSKWFIYGNVLCGEPVYVEFKYPEGQHNLA